ncbi:unnamed protein product [Linum tenue]|uniref:RNase H type-1 domain-containing protein n=1 Tax=Linum tenue TaxID=586396 RepID=A0AAV0Q2Y0_9ROSI|nr:unnamed protein product [Linum tenue]
MIRDHSGRCLTMFALNLGSCTITQAELKGAVEGLQVAWDAGHRRVNVQLHSRCVVQLLRRADYHYHHSATIIL